MNKDSGIITITLTNIILIIIVIIAICGCAFLLIHNNMSKTENKGKVSDVTETDQKNNEELKNSNEKFKLDDEFTTIIDDETVIVGMTKPKKSYKTSSGWFDTKPTNEEVEREGYLISFDFILKDDVDKIEQLKTSSITVGVNQVTFNENITNILVNKLSWYDRSFWSKDLKDGKGGISCVIDKELADEANLNSIEDIKQISFYFQISGMHYSKHVTCTFDENTIVPTVD